MIATSITLLLVGIYLLARDDRTLIDQMVGGFSIGFAATNIWWMLVTP